MLECVVNVSEGRRHGLVAALAEQVADDLLDVHADPHHNRSVFTLVGSSAARMLTRAAVGQIDLRAHSGVHPRLGAVDVVPFVPLRGSTMADAVASRDAFAAWAGEELGVPCFLYGPHRSLPDVRRRAFHDLAPDTGPQQPHPSAGAICVGARPLLVAYNVWLAAGVTIEEARRAAASVRSDAVRALGLVVGDRLQVSMNLIDPLVGAGPAEAFDAVANLVDVDGAELVGLIPEAALRRIPATRFAELDVGPERTIEHRLAVLAGRLGTMEG